MPKPVPIILIPAGHLGRVRNSLGHDTLSRLRRGLSLWRKTPEAVILVSGGLFRSPRLQTRPAADLMADWLLQNDVPANCILRERTSLDTFENVGNGLAVLKRQHLKVDSSNLIAVSQFQHVWRIWLTFRLGYGLRIRCIPIWYVDSVHGFFLEWPLLLHHLFGRRGEGWLARINRAWRRRKARQG